MTAPIPKLLTLQAITFLHPGTGQTTGVVDLPIQREVHTGYPMFASSGLKGSLRDKAERLFGKNHDKVLTTFGAATDTDNPSAGALALTDARILAFPVRSLQQVFVWITCPMVLKRLARDAALIGLSGLPPTIDDIAPEHAWVADTTEYPDDTLILEELAFHVEASKAVQVNAVANFISPLLQQNAGFDAKRLVIISNTDFQYLVQHATQVSARIKLNEDKTTTGGGGNLWYEETLPPETLLYAFALCHSPRTNNADEAKDAPYIAGVLDELQQDHHLQIGGNETVGQGWCCIHLSGMDKGGDA